tara:strand:- start:106 stop:912 length:807 start_codon:yes stop_codon:yes gene_type:complete
VKNLIYQYWDGKVLPGVKAGTKNMKEYANRIGAEYLFEQNPNWAAKQGYNFGKYTPHYGQFKIIYDEEFDSYDNILFVDTDVFAVDNLQQNIFEVFSGDIGICLEPDQPYLRSISSGHINSKSDKTWAEAIEKKYKKKMPVDKKRRPLVYNSGMVLYSSEGRKKIKQKFRPFNEYVNLIKKLNISPFYYCDQPYLHSMMFITELDIMVIDSEWNNILHYIGKGDNREVNDNRTKNTKFVHIQLSNADFYDENTLWRITNKPQSEWNLK